MKPTCARCQTRPAYSKSALCRPCPESLRDAGLKWCNACRQAVRIAAYGSDAVCRACRAARVKTGRQARRTLPRCGCCGTGVCARKSAICPACHAALRDAGQRWCNIGRHVVPGRETVQGGGCRACRAARARVARCATCQQPFATHARCQGCTRLYHGPLPPPELCRLCARDRARGVPAGGLPWREEVAA
jgi:hypothetical protein